MENTSADQDEFKSRVQTLLGKEITKLTLKGKGAVSIAYYVETADGGKYIVKQERIDKEFQPQNNLAVEAKVAQQLYDLNLSVPTPRVIFVSENPKMYGYEYIEGELTRGIWKTLSEDERISICAKLGHFHAEIGKRFTKEMAEATGIKINMSADLHPEVSADYNKLIHDSSVPEEFKVLMKKAKSIFEKTQDRLVFQFLHNDSHHENIIIKDKKISGIIDFGDAEYGEVAKEFSRYIRDFPKYFKYIVKAYEEESGNKLSYERLVSNALISGFVDNIENYRKGGEDRLKAEKAIDRYKGLIQEAPSLLN